MRLCIGLALLVMLATAVAWVQIGQKQNVRSLRKVA